MPALDLDAWHRRHHFALYRDYEHPHFSVSAEVDATALYEASRREGGPSFFLGTIFAALHAAHGVEAFRLRVRGDGVWRHDTVGIGCTVARPDRTFGFGYFPYQPSFTAFQRDGLAEVERVRAGTELLDHRGGDDAWLHSTILPWFRFTGFTNALRRGDSIPKIVFGKRFEADGGWRMPVAVQVHHGVVDGIDVADFLERLQSILSAPLPD